MNYICTRNMVVVAQLVRVSVCGTEGRGFESRLPPKSKNPSHLRRIFLLRLFSYFILRYFLFSKGNDDDY